jgi:hypothetical protein
MRYRIILTLVTLIAFTGCSKQESDIPTTDKNAATEFDKLDTIINGYLDKLDNPKTPIAERKQILCIDYPNIYNKEYAPLLLKNFPKDYTQAKLDQDLKLALDYYKGKDNIKC